MKGNRKIIIPMIALTVLLGAGAYNINNIYASEDDSVNSIVEKIAQKFNLNKDEVQKVFDENRSARLQDKEENFESRLDRAISEGKLTQEQKKLILDKRVEMRNSFEANKDSFKNLSKDEKQAQMKSNKEALTKWSSDNGIDLKYLMGGGGQKMGHQKLKINN